MKDVRLLGGGRKVGARGGLSGLAVRDTSGSTRPGRLAVRRTVLRSAPGDHLMGGPLPPPWGFTTGTSKHTVHIQCLRAGLQDRARGSTGRTKAPDEMFSKGPPWPGTIRTPPREPALALGFLTQHMALPTGQGAGKGYVTEVRSSLLEGGVGPWAPRSAQLGSMRE